MLNAQNFVPQVGAKKFLPLLLPLAFGLTLALGEKAIAHGVTIQHHQISAIQVQATYDSGEPMDNAQVSIYAPDDPTTPWIRGISNAQGEFVFVPEPGQTGTWTVRIRKAGHGQIAHISSPETRSNVELIAKSSNPEASQTAIASASLGGYTSIQKGVMIASVLWGFIGTTLFFSRSSRSKSNAHS
ncbi:MAG: carboxypeptidase regulatory-like domain-containing protein [Roseofilum sp. SBFL]|uniref:carboxypeptidase-like regulatory domain-containing protein n=1 Tax=Roseofilum sp. SBFL TaxID=2821496 RepID=UPI001B26040E|nr:carboxypeptidase-like regulatory domain-containing protein [Roseofilum sp. SBFL]MBP0041703.1 carboxypeptidase regulatory-like domain-containing protein [Roseofilum sp. SBFL]